MPTPRKIYLVQTSDPQEMNQVLSQVNEDVTKVSEDVTKVSDSTAKTGKFYTFDWEKDHADTLK